MLHSVWTLMHISANLVLFECVLCSRDKKGCSDKRDNTWQYTPCSHIKVLFVVYQLCIRRDISEFAFKSKPSLEFLYYVVACISFFDNNFFCFCLAILCAKSSGKKIYNYQESSFNLIQFSFHLE